MIICIISFYSIPEVLFAQIWSKYQEESIKVTSLPEVNESGPLKSEYLDVIISDIRTKNGFSFSVQILNTEGEYVVCPVTLISLFQKLHLWRK